MSSLTPVPREDTLSSDTPVPREDKEKPACGAGLQAGWAIRMDANRLLALEFAHRDAMAVLLDATEVAQANALGDVRAGG